MIKNKITLFLLISIFSIQFSLPSFAMPGDDDIDILLAQAQIKSKENKNKINDLESENLNIKKELENIKKEKEKIEKEKEKIEKSKNFYKKAEGKLKKEKEKLREDLEETDDLIEVLLNEKSTPTTHSFLRAVYNNKSEEELNRLFKEATNQQEIRDIIVGGHTKFREQSPDAHRKVLKLTGLLSNMSITESYSTVEYGRISISGTSSEELKNLEELADKSKVRRTSFHGAQELEKIKQKVKAEHEDKADAIQFTIQDSNKELNNPLHDTN